MTIIILAALSMLLQDLLAVGLVQAEARNKAVLAGIFDCLQWPAGIFCTTVSVTAFQGHDDPLKGAVIGVITLANFFGSFIAVKLGERFIREEVKPCTTCGTGTPASGQGSS